MRYLVFDANLTQRWRRVKEFVDSCTDANFWVDSTGTIDTVKKVISTIGMTTVNSASSSTMKVFPNPYTGSTNIEYTLADRSNVSVKVYNILGQEVQALTELQEFSKGTHQIEFHAQGIASGLYFVRIYSPQGKFQAIRKMAFVK